MPFEKGKSGYTKPPTQWLSGEVQHVTRLFPPALRERFHCRNVEGQQFCLLVERLALLNNEGLAYVDALLSTLEGFIVKKGKSPDSEEKKQRIIDALHSI